MMLCNDPAHKHTDGDDARRCALIYSMRHLLLPGIYRFPKLGGAWDLYVDNAPHIRRLCLLCGGYGQVIFITTDIELDTKDGQQKAIDRFAKISKEIEAGHKQQKEHGLPVPIQVINAAIAEKVLALINSKPSTPTGGEIIHAIDMAHAELRVPRPGSVAALDKPRDLGNLGEAFAKTNNKLTQAMADSIYGGKTKDAYWAAKLNDCKAEVIPLPYKDPSPALMTLIHRHHHAHAWCWEKATRCDANGKEEGYRCTACGHFTTSREEMENSGA